MSESSAPSYLRDTWGFRKYAGTWCFDAPSLQGRGSYAGALATLAIALKGCGRMARIEIESPEPSHAGRILSAPLGTGLALDDACAFVTAFHGPISLVAVTVDLFVHVRTDASTEPTRAWIREPTEVALSAGGGELALRPQVWLTLEHTLFHATSRAGDDNRVLYWKNRPLLRELLHRLSAHFGSLIECEDGATPEGYPQPDDDDGGPNEFCQP